MSLLKSKQRQIQLKTERTVDEQCRKEWSKNVAKILTVAMTVMKTTVNSSQKGRKSVSNDRHLEGSVGLVEPPHSNIHPQGLSFQQEKPENWHFQGR